MKTNYVQEFQPNDKIVSFFLVQLKEVRVKKGSGDPYLSLQLSDRTGQIEAKMWDGVDEVADTFDRDDFIKVKANIQLYRDKPQMIIQRLRRAEESEIDLADYMPHTKRDIDEMMTELRGTVDGFTNTHLKTLLLAFLDDEQIASRLRIAPAAKTLHHATVGGLLEHICSLLGLAQRVASNYDYLDLDLLLTGVVLHDICKLDELTYERSFGYSSDGQLLGHISMGLQLIERKCVDLPEFPPRLKRLVEHMVLSHHGRYEFGSPKLPMFPEALALSYIDDLDSKLESMRASLEAEASFGQEWTRFNPALDRPVLNVARYLSGPAEDEPAPAATAPTTAPTPPDNDADWTAPPPLPSTGLLGEKLQLALGRKEAK